MNDKKLILVLMLLTCLVAGCKQRVSLPKSATALPERPVYKPLPASASPNLKQLIAGATAQAGVTTGYDPSYVKLNYPLGDVPKETGVCSDVVVRAFRSAGVDLQKEVHEDMARAWSEYPRKWGTSAPDANIDHRRVLNLMTYFVRQGKSLPVTVHADDYLPGDVVAWDLGNGLDHIGLVTNMWSESEKRCLMIHNIGAGARVEDLLFAWKITGHYRYFP
jgi:uncharacterized protein YijF (DUF1287 family)